MNKILDEFLEEDEQEYIPQFEKENFILEPLLDEIEAIKEEAIRNFVRSVLLKNKAFWIIPSTFSEDYNPPDEHDVGGNVLHTKRVFRICALLADSHILSAIERDILLAAALLHDVTKGVITRDEELPAYDEFHPYTVDRFVRQVKIDDELHGGENQSTMLFLEEEHATRILRIIRCHMGIWSPIPETYPINDLEMILYTADTIAVRLHWIIDGEDLVMERWDYAG